MDDEEVWRHAAMRDLLVEWTMRNCVETRCNEGSSSRMDDEEVSRHAAMRDLLVEWTMRKCGDTLQ